jgi:hypothetical protein
MDSVLCCQPSEAVSSVCQCCPAASVVHQDLCALPAFCQTSESRAVLARLLVVWSLARGACKTWSRLHLPAYIAKSIFTQTVSASLTCVSRLKQRACTDCFMCSHSRERSGGVWCGAGGRAGGAGGKRSRHGRDCRWTGACRRCCCAARMSFCYIMYTLADFCS